MAMLGLSGKLATFLAQAHDLLTPKSLIALAWPLFLVWFGRAAIHLLVWFKEDVIVYPSRATRDESLPLSFGGDSARSVTLLPVHIVNDGKRLIGSEAGGPRGPDSQATSCHCCNN